MCPLPWQIAALMICRSQWLTSLILSLPRISPLFLLQFYWKALEQRWRWLVWQQNSHLLIWVYFRLQLYISKDLHERGSFIANGVEHGPFHDVRKRQVGNVDIIMFKMKLRFKMDTCDKGKCIFMTYECSFWWSSGTTSIGEGIATISFYLWIYDHLLKLSAFLDEFTI